MSYPGDQSAPRPNPGAMPRRQYDPMSALNDSTDADLDVPDVEATVSELLAQVDRIRESTGDEFSLAALERQAVLLEQAHDVLTAALDAVDRR
ncbi:hypothetical protein ACN94_19190 [Gordonia paraffinivorans]|nr:hypothetical protein [Gordonia paraffinivorans]MBY4575682.1 hypothetical protein [Gordonia paraffinivorans]MCD2144755.1 hypothetical protein [Gordonia paraffinivorans]PWD42205.1 hypothetical protein ACN93_15005 [Gordonia paraffinivorans]